MQQKKTNFSPPSKKETFKKGYLETFEATKCILANFLPVIIFDIYFEKLWKLFDVEFGNFGKISNLFGNSILDLKIFGVPLWKTLKNIGNFTSITYDDMYCTLKK